MTLTARHAPMHDISVKSAFPWSWERHYRDKLLGSIELISWHRGKRSTEPGREHRFCFLFRSFRGNKIINKNTDVLCRAPGRGYRRFSSFSVPLNSISSSLTLTLTLILIKKSPMSSPGGLGKDILCFCFVYLEIAISWERDTISFPQNSISKERDKK